MGPTSIPIRLTLTEICAAALMETADSIDAARDTAAFVTALDGNHRLWLAMREVGMADGWTVPSSRDSEFAILRSSSLGRGVTDANVEALVAVNRRVAEKMAGNADIERIRTRVRLAYRENGGGGFVSWLLGGMRRKERLGTPSAPTGERGIGRPPIGLMASA